MHQINIGEVTYFHVGLTALYNIILYTLVACGCIRHSSRKYCITREGALTPLSTALQLTGVYGYCLQGV
jgi:hypothetical protein